MIDSETINDIAEKIKSLLPADLAKARDDFSKNVAVILQSKLRDLKLVTREEFDVQVALLQRSQEKLALLEKELAELSGKS